MLLLIEDELEWCERVASASSALVDFTLRRWVELGVQIVDGGGRQAAHRRHHANLPHAETEQQGRTRGAEADGEKWQDRPSSRAQASRACLCSLLQAEREDESDVCKGEKRDVRHGRESVSGGQAKLTLSHRVIGWPLLHAALSRCVSVVSLL